MIGYKTDTETVSWTLDDPLFSFDSGHPQKRRSYSSKILDSATTTATICIHIYENKNHHRRRPPQGSMRWKIQLKDMVVSLNRHHHDCQYLDTSKCLNAKTLTNPKTIILFASSHTHKHTYIHTHKCLLAWHNRPYNRACTSTIHTWCP